MSNDDNRNDSAAPRTLHGVLADYIRRREAGESIDIESYCDAYPELADGLRSYAEGEGLLDALSNSAGVDAGNGQSAETLRPGAAQRTDFAPQAEFGRYRLIRQLGNGAMGAVYLADDTQLGRQVALKIPRGTGTEGPEFLKRFTRESQAAARLDHPNLCRIYDAGDVRGTPFISMEYIDGPPLSQCVGVAAYQDQRRVVEIVSGIASGLQLAHERGILHRDVKSSNVLMKNGETPCVTDFGLARIEGGQESKLTQDGAILGTPAYMAPEQIRAELDRIGPPSDVYALGVVLYELLAGHTPFQGSTLVILNQALNERPPSLRKHRPEVDPQLADFCLRMLEKKPEQRPQSMQDVVEFLQQWLKATSPGNQARKAKEEQERAKYEAIKSRALELIQRGQHAQAIDALEKMQALNGTLAKPYADWARAKIPEVKKLSKQLKEGIPALVTMARKFLRGHDYAQAVQLLQDIPPDFRSPEVQQLLDKALELQEESDLLLLSLQECVRTKQLQGIEDNLKRFLKLNPGNKFAKELWESLQTYGKIPRKDRRYQFDDKGRLQPNSSGSIWDNWLLMGSLCFAFVFGLMTWAIVIYLKDGGRTLTVEVNDAWLKEQGGQLSLSVDGKEHTISGPDMEIKVTFGDHGFSVKNGDTVVHNPQTFSIEKGTTPVLRIDASGMRLETPVPGNSTDPTVSAKAKAVDPQLVRSYDFTELAEQDLGANGLAPTGREAEAYFSVGKFLYRFPDGGKSSPELLAEKGGAYDLDITSDGRNVVLARAFGRVEIWTTQPWEMKHRLAFSDTSGQATDVAISPDGRWVGAVMMRGRAAVWELETGRLVTEIPIESDTAWTLRTAFTTDSRKLLVAGQNGTGRRIYEISTETGTVADKRCEGVPGLGAIVCGSADRVALASHPNSSLYVVDSRTWQNATVLGSAGSPNAIDWSPDTALLAVAAPNDGGLALYDGESLRWLKNIAVEGMTIEKVKFSRDSQVLAASGRVTRPGVNGKIPGIRVWWLSREGSPPADGPPGLVMTLKGHTDSILQIVPSPDGRYLISSSKDRTTKVWDITTSQVARELPLEPPASRLRFDADELVMGGPVGRLKRYRFSDGQLVLAYRGYPEDDREGSRTIGSIEPGHEPGTFVTCNFRGDVAVWKGRDAQPVQYFTTEAVFQNAYPVPEGYLLSGYGTQKARLVDRSGKTIREMFSMLSGGPIEVSPDKQVFLSIRDNKLVEVEIATGAELASYSTGWVNWRRFTSDGRFILCQDGDYNLQIWSRESDKELYRAKLPIRAAHEAISPDGRVLIVATAMFDSDKPNDEHEIYVWRLPKEVWPKLKREGVADSKLPLQPHPQDVWRSASNVDFVWCPPGKFRMGSGEAPLPDANETPAEVTLTQGRWVAKQEVTQAQWRSVMQTEPWKTFRDHQPTANHAATHMTWTEAVEYCRKLTEAERKAGAIPADWEFRLPSEAEWEYFARAGTTTKYSFGDDATQLGEHAWWRDNADAKGEKYAHEVGKFKPNPWGLYDIHGNVYEWCLDTFTAKLPGGTDPVVNEPGNTNRVNRGGGWDGRDEKAHTSSNRRWTPENERRNNLGLRVMLARMTMVAIPHGQKVEGEQGPVNPPTEATRSGAAEPKPRPLEPKLNTQFTESLKGKLLAHYVFDRNLTDNAGRGSRMLLLKRPEYRQDTLYLDGTFLPPGPDSRGLPRDLAIFSVPAINSGSFTVILRARAETALGRPYLIGGNMSRWFAFERNDDGTLRVGMDSWKWRHDFKAVRIEPKRWYVLACGVDLNSHKCVVSVDGEMIGSANIPADIALDSSAFKNPYVTMEQKAFTVTNSLHGESFEGQVDEIIVCDGLLPQESLARSIAQ